MSALANLYGYHRYAILFYTLLFTLAAAPLLTALHFSGDLLQLLLAFNLLVALLGITGRAWRNVLLVLAAAAIALRAAPASAVGHRLGDGALLAVGGIALVAVVSAIRFALSTKI